ncbi:MAG: BatD family protein [Elusimicrobiales bacterium]|nr:BatD family protein [Elusimicrobiales bacterium]
MNLIGRIFLFLIILTKHINCQIVVTAWVDKKTVPINESFTLTISVSGENITNIKPDIPNFIDFNIYQSGKSSNISIINGQISTTIEFSYTLIPKRTGKFIIPKIGIFTGKEKYFTKEIEIEVTAPSISSQQTTKTQQKTQQIQDKKNSNISRENLIFAKATVDKKTAYIGEQITLSIKFYTALPVASNPQYYPPTYSNLISEDLPPIRTGTEIINGIRYYVAETKTALFGIIAGKAKISSAKIIAPIQEDTVFDPFDPNFIQKFFSQMARTQDITLETKPIEIEILDLPQPPKDFSGAVGNFFITAKIDNTTPHAGDPINITIEISGKGNVKQITPPQINHQSLKIYDILSSETNSKNNDIIGGTKKFTYITTPLTEGNIYIDGIKFTFFNIDTKNYETITTQPLKITALKGKTGKTYDFDTSKGKSEISAKGEDINYIYEKIPSSTLYYIIINKISNITFIIQIITISLLIIFIIVKIIINSSDKSHFQKYEKAYSNFERKIKEASKQPSEKRLSIIYDTIHDYFSDKLNENIAHLSFAKIKHMIKEKEPLISDGILNELEEIINKIELLNFTKTQVSNSEIESLVENLKIIIKKIDKEMKR